MIRSLDHLHIYATDPRATIAFYERCLDGEYLGRIPSQSGDGNHGVILGGQLLVISRFPEGMTAATPPVAGDGALESGYGIAHFGVQTSDLDGVVRRLSAEGYAPHAAPRRTGSIRYVYVTAPDGVVVEVVELHLPPKLAPFMPLLAVVDRSIHATRRLLAKQLFR